MTRHPASPGVLRVQKRHRPIARPLPRHDINPRLSLGNCLVHNNAAALEQCSAYSRRECAASQLARQSVHALPHCSSIYASIIDACQRNHSPLLFWVFDIPHFL
jgi:hypothetical protein